MNHSADPSKHTCGAKTPTTEGGASDIAETRDLSPERRPEHHRAPPTILRPAHSPIRSAA